VLAQVDSAVVDFVGEGEHGGWELYVYVVDLGVAPAEVEEEAHVDGLAAFAAAVGPVEDAVLNAVTVVEDFVAVVFVVDPGPGVPVAERALLVGDSDFVEGVGPGFVFDFVGASD
jgi:hypothetical protein